MKTRVALSWGLLRLPDHHQRRFMCCDHSNNNAVDIVTVYIPQNHGGKQKQNEDEFIKTVDAEALHRMWGLAKKNRDYAGIRK